MAAATTQEFKVIGTRPIRHDGVDKVTGRARYGADYSFPGMLHGKVLRSPFAHARIKSINLEQALALPGVKAIVTGADLPELPNRMEALGEIPFNPHSCSHNVLARDKVLYNGHAIAAVAATSPHIAEEALGLIEVEYEQLPVVTEVREAMAPGAPILHPDIRTAESGDEPTNVASHLQFKRGDLEAGFRAADYIIEREFNTAMVHQGYIEPHNAVAMCNSDGRVTVYCSTQAPFEVRMMTAQVLGMPVGDVKVVPAEIGGGFGGKYMVYLEPLSVLLSKKTGAPVKMVMNRAEVLRASGPTSGSFIKVRMGASKAGKITAAEISLAYEAGAFPGSPVGAGAMTAIAPYDIDNFVIDGYDVVVNRPKTGGYRAPGASNAAFASETVIDELAEKCGIDPIEFRIMNAVREGTPQIAGPPFKRIGFVEVCEALRNSHHYKSELGGNNRGRGVAFGFWFNGGMQSSALVNIHVDGTASVVTGNPDIGGSRASMAMIAAEVLGLRGRGCAAQRRRYRLDRSMRRDRRQPRYDGHRAGGLRGLPRCHPPDQGARRAGLENKSRRRRLPRRPGHLKEQRRGADEPEGTGRQIRAHRRAGQRPGQRQCERGRTHLRAACWWMSKSTPIPGRSRSCAARSRRTPARRSIPATWKARCRAGLRRGSAGR